MAVETFTEKRICNSCGADVRPNTTFCYNCGAAVAENSVIKTEKSIGAEKSNSLRPAVSDAQNGKTSEQKIDLKTGDTIPKPVEKPFAAPLQVKTESAEIEEKKVEPQEKPALKTAASMRRQPKSALSKNVEVVWEQPENSTSVWFFIFSIILILFAVGALLAMLYLK